MNPRQVRALVSAGLAMLALFAGGACDQPTQPSYVPPATTPVGGPRLIPTPSSSPGVSKAVLAVSTFTVRYGEAVAEDPSLHWYVPKVVLTETSGRSGAHLTALEIWGARGSRGRDQGCGSPPTAVRIEPHGTWDMDSLGYCAPEAGTGRAFDPTAKFTLVVSFHDDDGNEAILADTVLAVQ